MLKSLARMAARIASFLLLLDVQAAAKSDGILLPAGHMTVPRAAHTATLLADGRILIAGGMERDNMLTDTSELFDPRMNTFTPGARLTTKRVGHTATLLNDGRVLLVGGFAGREALASAEVYDPQIDAFQPTGSLAAPRGGFTATRLLDGKVLIAGGSSQKIYYASAELYDPASGSFTPVGDMTTPRAAHTATLLADGRVLIAGGSAAKGQVLASAELYDPISGKFIPTGAMTVMRHKHAAVLLTDSQVLILGGSNDRDWRGRYTSVERYDPTAAAFTASGDLHAARFKLADAVVRLTDGTVLVAGGGLGVEHFDPLKPGFDLLNGDMKAARFYMTATALPDGRALILGGYDTNIAATTGAWLYGAQQ